MSSYYSPGCHNEKAHICDCCEKDDGRPTLYWQEKDFDLCFDCLKELSHQHIDSFLKLKEKILFNRITVKESLRNEIFERDNNRCLNCGISNDLTIDHIVPFSRGGKTEKENLQTLCQKCNKGKRDGVTATR